MKKFTEWLLRLFTILSRLCKLRHNRDKIWFSKQMRDINESKSNIVIELDSDGNIIGDTMPYINTCNDKISWIIVTNKL